VNPTKNPWQSQPPSPPAPLPQAGEGSLDPAAKLWIVGCGPGSVGYLTDAAREAAAGAEVLVGSKRLLAMFPDGPAERIFVGANIDAAMDQIGARRAVGQRVVVLVGGDPGLHSLAQNVIRRFGRPCCELVPAVSSVQVAFARLGMDWSDARILSAHGRTPAITADELAEADKIAILAGTKDALRWSAAMAAALRASHAVFLAENLTLDSERFQPLTAEQLAECEASSLSIVLLIRKVLLA
jgi:precorrin-6y C5,15-methyltransferase (decarboxylating) CbiE subunit